MPPAGAHNTGGPGSGQLRRVQGLGKTTTILMTGIVVMTVVQVLLLNSLRPKAQAFLDGEMSEQAYVSELGPLAASGVVMLLISIASMVMTMVWLYRIAKNNVLLGRSATWGPGWAIGGWFAPPALFVIPTLFINQQWRANAARTTPSNWQQSARSPLVVAWGIAFSLWLLLPLNDRISNDPISGVNEIQSSAEATVHVSGVTYVATAFSVLAAVLFAVIAYQLTARHVQMTGETAA